LESDVQLGYAAKTVVSFFLDLISWHTLMGSWSIDSSSTWVDI